MSKIGALCSTAAVNTAPVPTRVTRNGTDAKLNHAATIASRRVRIASSSAIASYGAIDCGMTHMRASSRASGRRQRTNATSRMNPPGRNTIGVKWYAPRTLISHSVIHAGRSANDTAMSDNAMPAFQYSAGRRAVRWAKAKTTAPAVVGFATERNPSHGTTAIAVKIADHCDSCAVSTAGYVTRQSNGHHARDVNAYASTPNPTAFHAAAAQTCGSRQNGSVTNTAGNG